jgi:ComF family protein
MLAAEMVMSGRFSTIDVVVPVPLHPKKKRKRGYNQVSGFGKVLADGLGAAYEEDALIRNRDDSSMTRMNRVERSEILTQAFAIPDSSRLTGKHVLLVDDIITSGSTLEACAKIVQKLPDSEVSLASMAFTL